MRLPGYEINGEIHRGRKRVIYRGRREEDHLPVVIKTLINDFPSAGDIATLRHEYDVLQNLNIDGVIKAYALETRQNRPAIILEDIDGQPLKQHIQSQKIDAPTFLNIAIQLAAALGELHNRNVIHKDINPKNIIVNLATGQTRVIDFSLSSLLPMETAKISHPDVMEGTLAYMSPEQTGRMNRALDYRSDLYSLGVTFYEMLTGALPFNSDDPLEIVHWHLAKAPADPRELNPEIPEMLARILMKLLAKTAEQRYYSGFGVRADLERCQQQLRATGRIEIFPVGEHDTSERFYIPQKLYGRESEIANLLAAFQRVCAGACELMLVSGYAGVGKTSLIQEIQKPVVGRKGFFISGKFDQLSRQMPYTAVIQAFQELVRLILTESEDSIRLWKRQLLNALGNNAHVIIEVIPELELILGPQPQVPQLAPAEAQNRFDLYFQKLIGVFASADHPLALFLDDLQWADPASLRLLQTIITGMEIRNFLLIGAYRNNEVNDHHPLIKSVRQLRQADVVIHEIVLRPLNLTSTNQLIADTLSCVPDHAQPLAGLIHKKTGGNPFFVRAFLKSLHDEEMLRYVRTAGGNHGGWQWELEKIQQMQATDNVVDFMIRKLNRLPADTQDVLKLAACIGNRFTLDTLAMVCQRSTGEISSNLFPALQENLLVRAEDFYSFYHDRIQEAAYSMIPEAQKQEVHLRVGRLLLAGAQNLSAKPIRPGGDESIFDVVDHLNLAAALISDEKERRECAQLNLRAGLKAKSSTAYKPARNYFQTGINFLTPESWNSNYELTFTLHRELAECEYLCGNFEDAEQHFDFLLQQAKTHLEKAEIYNLKMIQHENRANYGAAVKAGRQGLKLLGIELPESEQEKLAALESELQLIQKNLGGRTIAELIDLPVITAPAIKMSMKLLMTIWSNTYITGDNLQTRLISASMVRLSLQYGNTEESAYGYVTHTILVGPVRGDYQAAYEWGKLALQVNERFHDQKSRAKINQQFHAHVNLWCRHLETSLPYAQEACRSGLENGDFTYGGYGSFTGLWNTLLINRELEQFANDCLSSLALLKRIRMTGAADGLMTHLNWARALQGRTAGQLSLTDADFDEEAYIAAYQSNPFYMTFFYGMKLSLCVFFGEYERALELTRSLRQLTHNLDGTIWPVILNFLSALTLSNLYSGANENQQRAWRQELEGLRDFFAALAKSCPENYRHMHRLISAEMARLGGQQDAAMELYEQAIQSAGENGFIQNEALANELFAKYWLSRKQEKIARLYLNEAYYAYCRWGATAKLKQLQQAYPDWIRRPDDGRAEISLASRSLVTAGADTDELDLNTVVKAAQAISGEMVLEQLIQKLMKIVIENAAAQTGYLLLQKNGELVVEATGSVERDEVTVLPPAPSEMTAAREQNLPQTVLNYVKRTHLYLVIADARNDARFANDPYVIAKKPKSILCTPILNQGRFIGILYLENNLTADAFAPHRIEMMQILCSQAAIALENSRLYEDTKQEIAERKRTEEILRAITAGTAEVASGDFFRSLVRHLATALKVQIALVTECTDASLTKVRTLAYFKNDEFKENIEYELRGTPCEKVIAGQICFYPDKLDKLFPREQGLKSYIGVPLSDSAGKQIGHLAIIDDKPMTEEKRFLPILTIFAARAAVELERNRAEAALRESEERFRSGYEHASIGMAMTAADGHFLSVNHAFCEMLGYAEKELLARTFKEITFPDDVAASVANVQKVIRGDMESFQVEKRYLHRDGRIVWAITTASVVRDLDGKPWYLFAQIQDITERKRAEMELHKAHSELEQRVRMRTEELSNANTLLTQQINERLQAEQALKASERRLTLALDATRDGLYDWDIPSGNAFVSDNYYKMLHYEPNEFEINFEKWTQLLHPDDLPIAIQQLQSYMQGKTDIYSVEYRLLCKDGSYKWVHNRGKIVEYDQRGNPKRMIGTNADISARKHAETALRESEARFRRLFEHAGDAFFVVNLDGKFIDVNQEACRGLGYTREELLTKEVKDLNEEWTAERIADLMQRLLLGEPVKFEATHRRKNGTIFPVEIHAALLEVGDHPTLLALARDITERKQVEIKLQEAKEAAEAANRAKSEFLANMSHEIRTPLNGILGYTQILRRDPKLTAAQREGLNIIERSGEHLLTLINDILDLSKIEAGKLDLDIVEFDLLEFLKNIVEVNRIRAEQKDLAFNYQTRSALPQIVKGDEKRLRQVLLNLLSNAVKFTDAGGVTFSAECLKLESGVAALRFEVEDTGIGIPTAKLQEIFLPFQQVRQRNKPIEGTGLGLSITQNIINLMGGELNVNSKPGKGSIFQVTLRMPVVAMTAPRKRKAEKRIVGYHGLAKKILIVDDKWENRAVLINMLKPLGFNVTEAADGRDAIKQAGVFKPDLILMDLIMPVMDGLQATRKIRKLKRLKAARIIALSASVFEHNRQQSLAAGCDDFIPKPVRSEVLFKRLRTHLKLRWIYDRETSEPVETEPAAASTQPLTAPPAAIALQLNELAMMGDVQAILAKLDELEKGNGDFRAFNSEIRRLAKNYSMKKIREFLKPYLQKRGVLE